MAGQSVSAKAKVTVHVSNSWDNASTGQIYSNTLVSFFYFFPSTPPSLSNFNLQINKSML